MVWLSDGAYNIMIPDLLSEIVNIFILWFIAQCGVLKFWGVMLAYGFAGWNVRGQFGARMATSAIQVNHDGYHMMS